MRHRTTNLYIVITNFADLAAITEIIVISFLTIPSPHNCLVIDNGPGSNMKVLAICIAPTIVHVNTL